VVYAFQEECASSYGMFLGQDGRKVCGAALSLSTWAYLTLTYDGSTLRIYKDAVQVSTLAVQEFALEDPNPLLIGRNIFGSGFVGVIDEVRIYNEAIPVNNGTGDLCGDTAASITRDMNCAMAPSLWVRKLTMYTLATAGGIYRENEGRARGAGFTLGPLFISQCRVYDSKPLTAVIEMKGKFS
jgi:Concanavalin A-like lectin/glucanases superfamily